MESIKVTGGIQLNGTITPSGNKNAVLPILCATLLTDEKVVIHNVPEITDLKKITSLMQDLGSEITQDAEAKTLTVDNKNLSLDKFDGSLPVGMRSALLLISPLLSRFKKLKINTEIGGCTLGIREIDTHIAPLAKMGANVDRSDSITTLTLKNHRFEPAHIWPNYASVTSTENMIMAAVRGKGTTTITNAAAEPHVQDLCNALTAMGAIISGIGSNQLIIEDVETLHGADVYVSSDHHEITTFLALGAMTNGEIRVKNAIPHHFPLIVSEFQKLGVEVLYEENTAVVKPNQSFEPEVPFTKNYIPRIEAAPWPYFPVDLLPLMISLSLKTKGAIRFWNKVYEAGLFWVTELLKMGAKIEVSDPHRIIVMGPTDLNAANLDCPYIIRATVALMMAAMTAEGTSTLNNYESIYRAHPNFFENLRALGAQIEEVHREK